ncbi:hypothetical protein QFC19_008202 [Naganishia cerealis]|uniref:Uncharacterized protein n=1 Tax=Naganishia cerealis TaxID=610337 RepID=A0ACC2V3S6_9TREE|nr:hypothetical protein QFC19_008202 [Naganishia cerealis]
MPGSSVSAVQIAAHKKLVLVDLIISGEAPQYGKMISGQVNAAFGLHAAEYTALGQAYRELNYGALKRLLENKTEVFRQVRSFVWFPFCALPLCGRLTRRLPTRDAQDMNYGLLLSVYEAIPARRLINLRETYVKMDMEKLASEISVGSFTELTPHEAEELVVKLVRRFALPLPRTDMFKRASCEQVREGKLHARIERPQRTTVAQVSFIDDAEPFNTSTTVDRIGVEMKSVQDVTGKLVGLEQAWSMHEGWLKEVRRSSLSFPCVMRPADVLDDRAGPAQGKR